MSGRLFPSFGVRRRSTGQASRGLGDFQTEIESVLGSQMTVNPVLLMGAGLAVFAIMYLVSTGPARKTREARYERAKRLEAQARKLREQRD